MVIVKQFQESLERANCFSQATCIRKLWHWWWDLTKAMGFTLETICFQTLSRGMDCRAELSLDNNNSRRSSWRDRWSAKIVQLTLNTVTDCYHFFDELVVMVFHDIEQYTSHTVAVPRFSWFNSDDIRFDIFVVQNVSKDFVVALIAWRIHDKERNCRKNRPSVLFRSRLNRSDGRNKKSYARYVVQQFVELDTLRRNSTTCEVKVSISHAPYSSTAY